MNCFWLLCLTMLIWQYSLWIRICIYGLWRNIKTPTLSQKSWTMICLVRDCLVFSTDTVCALWPGWSSGVVQGSLSLSGGGLMVHLLSLCVCYICVYCTCLHARSSIIVILTDTFTMCSWRLVSEIADYPSSHHGPTVLSQLLNFFCFFLFFLLLTQPWCFVVEQTALSAFPHSLAHMIDFLSPYMDQ